MSSLVMQSPPAAEPVTLATVKNHLRITISSDDALLALYIQSARETIESESGRSLVNKIYRQSHDRFPHLHVFNGLGSGFTYRAPIYSRDHHHRDHKHEIKLLRSPLIRGSSYIVYVGTDGNLYTMFPGPSAAGDPYQAPERWTADADYELGDFAIDANGGLQQVTAVSEAETGGQSESSATEPTWNQTVGLTTTDRDLTWTLRPPQSPTGGNYIEDPDAEPSRLTPQYGQFWPQTLAVPRAVQVSFISGYGNDAAAAPARLKVALMMAVGVSYQQREAVTAEQLRTFEWYDRLVLGERVQDYNPTP